MKKFLTALAVGVLTVVAALGFSACGGKDEVKYTVTEEEWKRRSTFLILRPTLTVPIFQVQSSLRERKGVAQTLFSISAAKSFILRRVREPTIRIPFLERFGRSNLWFGRRN